MVKWVESYEVYRADIGLISLIVKPKPARQGEKWAGYVISISGGNKVIRPETIYVSVDEAKAQAVKIARRQVAKMAVMLDEQQEMGE